MSCSNSVNEHENFLRGTGWFDSDEVLPEGSMTVPVWTRDGNLEIAYYSRLGKQFYDPLGGIIDVTYWHSNLGDPF